MKMTYQSAGRSRSLQFNPMSSLASGVPSAAAPASARKLAARKPAARAASATGPLPFSDPGASLYDALSAIKKDGFKALHDSWNNISESDTRYMLDAEGQTLVIATTDISGKKGYSKNDFTPTFNGTSSATPHVAAAAALVLSVNPALKMQQVRDILTGTCDPLVPGGKWHPEYGAGRLNIFAAVRRALR
jgi:subtilisin family serine protease